MTHGRLLRHCPLSDEDEKGKNYFLDRHDTLRRNNKYASKWYSLLVFDVVEGLKSLKIIQSQLVYGKSMNTNKLKIT